MRSTGKSIGTRIVAATLCTLLSISPLVGCASTAQNANNATTEQENMYKGGEETEFKGKKVPYSKQGAYTVTLGEGDFLPFEEGEAGSDANATAEKNKSEMGTEPNANNVAEQQNEKAATDAKALEDAKTELENAKTARDDAKNALDSAAEAEKNAEAEVQTQAQAQAGTKTNEQPTTNSDTEMGAEGGATTANADSAATQEKTDAHNKAVEERKQAEENLAKAEESVKTAEQKVADLEASVNQTNAAPASAEAQPAAATQDNKTRTFGDLKAEDIKVVYSVLTNRAEFEAGEPGSVEPQFETREAQVSALSNDNGSMTVSFTDSDAASNATNSYVVVAEGMKKYVPVLVEFSQPTLTAESGVKSGSESSDVIIKVANDKFAASLSAGDLKLGGSFGGMNVTGAEATGDTLTVHLSGTPKIDRTASSVYTDGQIVVPASGFENGTADATALVPINLPDAAFDLEGAEALPTAAITGKVDYATIDGDTGKATLYLSADLGDFNDVKPENLALEDGFAGGKVESVSKEGENGNTLKVEVSFPANGQKSDDYLLAGTIKLAAGAMKDESGNAAPEIETTVAVGSGKGMSKDGDDAEKKAEQREKRSETLRSYSNGIKYAREYLGKVDPTLAQISDFFAEALDMASNFTAGRYLDVLKNAEGLLGLCGITSGGQQEVTAADVLEEVKSLRKVVEAIDLKVDDISKENRADRYTQTSVRLKKMQDACVSASVMFKEGAKLLANRENNPMKVPAKGASQEEIAKYNAELRSLMLQEQEKERKGESKSTMFMDLDKTMSTLMDDLSTVSKWTSVDANAVNAAANPIDILDKLVAEKLNWDTQGYYARVAFRSELQFTMMDAWAYVSTYYNYADSAVAPKYQPVADGMTEAFKQIAARPAGQSPDEIRKLNQAGKDISVYSPSLGITIKHSRKVTGGQPVGNKSIEDVDDKKINEYARRMQGSQWEDLELAGLEVGNKNDAFLGLGFRHHAELHADRAWYQVITRSPGISIRETWATILQQNPPTITYNKTSYVSWVQAGRTLKDDAWCTYYWFDRA